MSAPPVHPDVVDIATSLLLGTLWNWALYGVLMVQLYGQDVYSYNFPDDRKFLKLIVFAIFLLETLQTALSGADAYYWFASGFGKMDHLLDPYASVFDVPIMGSIVSGTVQLYFVYRVWVLSDRKSWWYCVLIAVCSTINTISSFSWGIYVSRTFISDRTLRIIALTCVTGSIVTDSLIASAMLFYLIGRRKAGSGPFCSHTVVKIVRLTIESNVLTTTGEIVSLLMVVIFPHKLYYTCPTAILGKLYSNTLLVSLNSRIAIREDSSRRRALPTNRTLAVSTSRNLSSIVHVTLERPPHAFEGRKQAGEDGENGSRAKAIDIV